MSRVIRLSHRYVRNAGRLGVVAGSPRGRAVGRTIAALGRDETLPALEDVRALLPPTSEAFVRRVPGRNLWLWYALARGEVVLVALTADPPVPSDG